MKKRRIKRRNIVILIVSIIVILLILLFIFFNPFLQIKTSNKQNIDLVLNEDYSLKEVKALYFGKDISSDIKVIGSINTKKVGTYVIKYKISRGLTNKVFKLTVVVKDKDAPSIVLNGGENITICPNATYQEQGYTAIDLYDGDLTSSVKVSEKDGNFIYVVSDKSNNKTTVTRTIIKEDKSIPIITLTGTSTYTIKLNGKFTDPGYKAEDLCDGTITDKVSISGSVDTSKKGTYKLTYTVTDSSSNVGTVTRTIIVGSSGSSDYSELVVGPTYINGILIVNKKYSLPSTYAPGVDATAKTALDSLIAAAKTNGHTINLVSSYRSYQTQASLYDQYVSKYGTIYADSISARPGHSEHQTGLAFDIGNLNSSFGGTTAGKWLAANCYKYGFIIRYPEGKTSITGYSYEPWHVRYLGIENATKVYNSGLTLEEYLGV